ncbi:hypothetical protein PR048_026276 [Dryococelus australis]|uniref:Uncharacterized protein n=1 Tax=Dryococelus australis TaxID=614101 RepID=A0ABQ9GKX4_9NEOP|nr:hypothetical protein PR048_026276 [Dryococelus australis]
MKIYFTFTGFIEMPKLLDYMEKNYTFWKDSEARGIVNSRDIERDRKEHILRNRRPREKTRKLIAVDEEETKRRRS